MYLTAITKDIQWGAYQLIQTFVDYCAAMGDDIEKNGIRSVYDIDQRLITALIDAHLENGDDGGKEMREEVLHRIQLQKGSKMMIILSPPPRAVDQPLFLQVLEYVEAGYGVDDAVFLVTTLGLAHE